MLFWPWVWRLGRKVAIFDAIAVLAVRDCSFATVEKRLYVYTEVTQSFIIHLSFVLHLLDCSVYLNLLERSLGANILTRLK